MALDECAGVGLPAGVDGDALVAWACRRNAVVRVACCVGEFVVEGTPLLGTALRGTDPLRSAPATRSADADAALAGACTIGAYRTIDEDASFGIQQVVDIANKALSPGINDATTAVTAIDTLGAIFIRLGPRRIGAPSRVVDDVARLMAPAPTYADLVI